MLIHGQKLICNLGIPLNRDEGSHTVSLYTKLFGDVLKDIKNIELFGDRHALIYFLGGKDISKFFILLILLVKVFNDSNIT